MTQPVPRCDWSDLPNRECVHCHPEQRPAKPLTESEERDRLRREAVLALVPGMRVVFPIAHQEPTEHLPGLRHLPPDTAQWTIHDYVTALVDPTRHHESYAELQADADGNVVAVPARHRTDSPSLLQQLWSAAETSRGYDQGNRSAFGSRPSASLEALDVALEIEQGVHKMLRALGVVDTHDAYPDTAAAVRHLGSLISDGPPHKEEARTVRHWWAAARVVTGWDLPAFKPANTCPLCAALGSLRIKYPTGICVECREVWDEDTIGLLVEHVRAENREDEVEDDERIEA